MRLDSAQEGFKAGAEALVAVAVPRVDAVGGQTSPCWSARSAVPSCSAPRCACLPLHPGHAGSALDRPGSQLHYPYRYPERMVVPSRSRPLSLDAAGRYRPVRRCG